MHVLNVTVVFLMLQPFKRFSFELFNVYDDGIETVSLRMY